MRSPSRRFSLGRCGFSGLRSSKTSETSKPSPNVSDQRGSTSTPTSSPPLLSVIWRHPAWALLQKVRWALAALWCPLQRREDERRTQSSSRKISKIQNPSTCSVIHPKMFDGYAQVTMGLEDGVCGIQQGQQPSKIHATEGTRSCLGWRKVADENVTNFVGIGVCWLRAQRQVV